MSTFFFPDLTKQPPRSPRVRLGGYVILPRMLDKCRATIAGKNGEYHYNCPMDQNFLCFTGIDPEKLKEQAARGLGDGEMLEWITANAPHKRCEWEIAHWSAHMAGLTASDVETREFFSGELAKLTKTRDDIYTWADLLDLDDYVSFGGKA